MYVNVAFRFYELPQPSCSVQRWSGKKRDRFGAWWGRGRKRGGDAKRNGAVMHIQGNLCWDCKTE
jgi:hypothetical protein